MQPRKAPPSIHVASLALLLAASVQAGVALLASTSSKVGFGQWLFAAVVLGVLLWGIARAYRLAWLWGRYLTLFLGAVVALGLGVGLWKGEVPWRIGAIMAGGLVLPLLVTAVALGRPSALRWFDLYCPGCGNASGRAADFLFREARCKTCGDVY